MKPLALVVDDQPSNRKLMSKLLAARFQVVQAGSAEEARDRMNESMPDLLVLDLGLPGMSGLDFARHLKADKKTKDIPILAVTAYAMTDDQEKARRAGCDGYLSKPIDTRTFLDTAEKLIRRTERRARSLRVVVADDDPSARKALSDLLTKEGHAVSQAADGKEALDLLNTTSADVLVTDLLMPRLDGFQLCLEIRRSKKLRDLSILAYSATFSEPEEERLARRMGADRVVLKPAPPDLLLRTLRDLGEKNSSETREKPPEETVVLREYNQALVRKLESTLVKLHDLNEQLEKRVAERTRELEESRHEIELFSYSAAHDFKTPVRQILSFAQLLQKHLPEANADAAGYLEYIQRAAQHLKALTEYMLQLGRCSRQEIKRERVDLSGLAEKIVEEFRQREPNRAAGFRIEPGLSAQADPLLLEVALRNLLENAWKFTSRRADTRIEIGRAPTPGEDAFFVRDNGAGFDMTYQQNLFKPFKRLHTPADFPGTGMGLAIVQRVISRHGGHVWGEGAPDRGATFYFSLPKTPPPEDDRASASP
jgi:CheY-like chemotaxis protein